MKILVTGGAGFIGSHLCRYLIEKGNQVICMDNFYTGRKENISDLLNNPNFTLMEHDITQPYDVEVDQIYNLACPASPVHYQKDPIKTIQCSTLGVYNALELAKKRKIRILQASTSEVYGDPEVHPQPETYVGAVNTIGPRACYDEGKRVAETMCMDYHREKNIDIRIIRIFNTFGPSMEVNDGRVMSNFIIQSLQNKPITIYGNGSQTRSFCYVSDLVNGMYKMMNQDNFTGPVNLGNPTEYTMKQLAELILELTNSKSEITYHPLPKDDPKQRQPDISLAKEKLNWEPSHDVIDGIKKTIEYFKKELN